LKIDPADLFSTPEEQIRRAYDIQSERIAYMRKNDTKMKILHTSDWHLGRAFYNRKRYDEHEAFLNCLRN
jgi:hypothetical protein